VAPVTTRVRRIPTEVDLGDGLPKIAAVEAALRFVLGLP
jgi:hypothetical protein